MSAKACGLTSCASSPMDGGGAKGGDGEGRAERIERYKKQRREELAKHHAAKVPEEGSGPAAAAKLKGPAKSPDTQGHAADRASASSGPERKNCAPSVRMTKASRLRALSHAVTPQGTSPDQHSKLELPQRGERQSLKPLDLNDNIPSRVQAPTVNSKAAPGLARPLSAEKGPAKRKPPTTASRSSLPGNTMGRSQSRPAVKETQNPVHNPESNLGDTAQAQEAENLVPSASPLPVLKPLDAFHTFGEEEPSGSSAVSKDEGQQAAFNTHCSALPDLPCDKGVPASPRVFSVTFHTTSTSYLPPLDRRASCPDRTAVEAQPKDSLVSSPSPTKSPSRHEALRPWTKAYSPVKQPLTPKKTPPCDVHASPTSAAVDSKPAASGSLLVGRQGPKPWAKARSPSLDRVHAPAQKSETLQVVQVSPVLSSDHPSAQISAVEAEVNLPELEQPSVHFGAARKRSTSLFDEVDRGKRELPGEDAVEASPSEELRLHRKSERSASLSEVVHGILKANPREDDRPRHSILKNRSSSSEERDHSPELHSILKSKEDIAKPEDTARPRPILKKHEDGASVLNEPKPILKRKSIEEDCEERLKPILKNQQQRRWSHEHSPDKGEAVVVRRRSHSIELETKPVLSFAEAPPNNSSGGVRSGLEQKQPEVCDLREGAGVLDPVPLTPQAGGPVLESKVVSCCPPLDSASGLLATGLRAEAAPLGPALEVVPPPGDDTSAKLKSPTLVGFSQEALRQQKRYFRRNASCFKTQPVTASEIKASDNLESVRSFRNLVLKEASLSIFNKDKEGSRSETQLCVKKPEFPLPYSPPARSLRKDRERRRTLPVTSEEIEEAAKMETTSPKRSPSPAARVAAAAKVSDGEEPDPSKLSVAAKVSMFRNSLVLEAPKNGAERKRPARFMTAAERRLRSQTQPVTTEEVQQAAKDIEGQDKKPEVKEDDLSKMSLADKLKLFNQKVTLDVLCQKPPVRSSSMRRSAGPRMEAAEPPAQGAATALGLPLARTRSVSTPPEDAAQATTAAGAAPKGILKVQAGAQPVVKGILKQEHPEVKEDIKGILKPEQATEGAAAAPVKPILKPERSSPEVQSPSSSSSESSSEKEEEEDESSSESESESSSSEESSGPEEEDDKKKILLGGQRHLVIAQGSPSPQPGRKTITNPAVQRKLNASLRRKGEEER